MASDPLDQEYCTQMRHHSDGSCTQGGSDTRLGQLLLSLRSADGLGPRGARAPRHVETPRPQRNAAEAALEGMG